MLSSIGLLIKNIGTVSHHLREENFTFSFSPSYFFCLRLIHYAKQSLKLPRKHIRHDKAIIFTLGDEEGGKKIIHWAIDTLRRGTLSQPPPHPVILMLWNYISIWKHPLPLPEPEVSFCDRNGCKKVCVWWGKSGNMVSQPDCLRESQRTAYTSEKRNPIFSLVPPTFFQAMLNLEAPKESAVPKWSPGTNKTIGALTVRVLLW